MPEFIIVKEKRIKFWLIKNNVLEKWMHWYVKFWIHLYL
jgi:hypothetical protein